jgi:hypothetical protein
LSLAALAAGAVGDKIPEACYPFVFILVENYYVSSVFKLVSFCRMIIVERNCSAIVRWHV